MKYLEAQALTEQQKAADPHENKMMGGPQNKAFMGKQKPTPSAPSKTDPSSITDDAEALAKSLGVNLSTVTGTGANGQILPRDVRKAADEQRAKTNPSGSTPSKG